MAAPSSHRLHKLLGFRVSFPKSKRHVSRSAYRQHPTPIATRPELLARQSDRPLPSLASLNPNRKWIRTLPIFIAVIWASAAGLFNFQKVNSPVITATMYSLRTNPTVRQELGDEVYFASNWAWIWGSINLVHGNIDVKFSVKGTRQRGLCRFVAKRYGGRHGMFRTEEWSLTLDDGRVIQLLDQQKDPMEGLGV